MSKRDDLLKSLGGGPSKSMIGDAPPPGLDPASAQGPDHSRGITRRKDVWTIPLALIEPDPNQPRTEYDEDALTRLSESLKSRGQLQPIRVRKDELRGVYVIILGERRYRAAKLAGLSDLQCAIHERDLGDDEKLEIQLVENCLREDLRPIEQARAYRRLIDSQGWSVTQLARELAISQGAVSKALALLDLPAEVQQQVEQGILAPHTAYEVSRLDTSELQAEVAQAVVEQGLKRSEVSELVTAIRAKRPAPVARPEPVTLEVEPGVVVKITWKKAGGVEAEKALRMALRQLQARKAQEGCEAA
jgi:ParB family chromosome partitioning protein